MSSYHSSVFLLVIMLGHIIVMDELKYGIDSINARDPLSYMEIFHAYPKKD